MTAKLAPTPPTIDVRERVWMMISDRDRTLSRDTFDAIYDVGGYVAVTEFDTPGAIIPWCSLHTIIQRSKPWFGRIRR